MLMVADASVDDDEDRRVVVVARIGNGRGNGSTGLVKLIDIVEDSDVDPLAIAPWYG